MNDLDPMADMYGDVARVERRLSWAMRRIDGRNDKPRPAGVPDRGFVV